MDTKIIDQLFLELSQVTKASTKKEVQLTMRLNYIYAQLEQIKTLLIEGPHGSHVPAIKLIDFILK